MESIIQDPLSVGPMTFSGAAVHSLWTGGMMFDLNDLIANAPGWSLTAAYGINSTGQIVGTGVFEGQSTAFRLGH